MPWYLSSQKKQRDQDARRKKLNKARRQLRRLRPPGRGVAFTTEQAARQAAQRVLDKAGVQEWLRVQVEEEVQVEHVQAGPGRPGPDTLYKQVQRRTYKITVEDNEEALRQAERCDGLFPLMSNDKSLSLAEALKKYKYQPYAQKRHEQLKSVFGGRPVWLKSPRRVESLLWLYHLVELIQALLEREVRRHRGQHEIASLPLYPEKRHSAAPTAELVLTLLSGHKRYRLLDEQGRTLHTFHDPLPEVAVQVIDLLGVDRSAYGLPPRDQE